MVVPEFFGKCANVGVHTLTLTPPPHLCDLWISLPWHSSVLSFDVDPTHSAIAIQHQLAGFEGIFLETPKTRGEDHPRFLPRAPEITARQFGKFAAQTINVLGRSK